MKSKYKIKFLLLSYILVFVLFGCGKKDTITPFKEGLQSFYNNANSISISINSIDPNSENASIDLLAYLDEMNSTFDSLSELSIPDEYSDTEDKIQTAITSMHNANNLYHQAYGSETYDDALAQSAKDYYDKALQSIKDVGELLMGHNLETETE